MKRLISILISSCILVIIYTRIDVSGLIEVFKNCNPIWMFVSLGMVVPITLVTSWRLQQITPHKAKLGFLEANRLILSASVLNMVLPSKMGDIAKAYFMRKKGGVSGSLSLSIVIFEKACDMLSLLLWCAFGLLRYPEKGIFFWAVTVGVVGGLTIGTTILGSRQFARLFFTLLRRVMPVKISNKIKSMQISWEEMQTYFWGNWMQLSKIIVTSIFLWFLHLLQIWLFILALRANAPFLDSLALSSLAILAGLIPLTFAGIGTRDAALVKLYNPYFSPPVAAALGLLCTSRYILPAIGGIPFLNQHVSELNAFRSSARKKSFSKFSGITSARKPNKVSKVKNKARNLRHRFPKK